MNTTRPKESPWPPPPVLLISINNITGHSMVHAKDLEVALDAPLSLTPYPNNQQGVSALRWLRAHLVSVCFVPPLPLPPKSASLSLLPWALVILSLLGFLLPLVAPPIHSPHNYKSDQVTSLLNNTPTWYSLALRIKSTLLSLGFNGPPDLAPVSIFDLVFTLGWAISDFWAFVLAIPLLVTFFS